MKDAAQALADEQMSKVARDFSPACATVCLSGATIRSWLVTVARSRLPRSRRDAVDMADGLGTKQTHATLTMSTSASESSGRRDAIEADIAACCRKGFRVWEKSKIRQRDGPILRRLGSKERTCALLHHIYSKCSRLTMLNLSIRLQLHFTCTP